MSDLVERLRNLEPRLEFVRQTCREAADEIERLECGLIFGFYEDRYPSYSQGPQKSEIQSLATAKECNGLVEKIERLTAPVTDEEVKEAARYFNLGGTQYALERFLKGRMK